MPTISESEKKTRQRIAESVIGTHDMEGIKLDPAATQLLSRYASGALTLEEFSEAMDRCAAVLLEKRRALAGAA